MVEVYLVISSCGSYEDRYEHLEKAYFDKVKAEEHMEKYNYDLKQEIRLERRKYKHGLDYDCWVDEKHEARIKVIEVE